MVTPLTGSLVDGEHVLFTNSGKGKAYDYGNMYCSLNALQ